MNEIRNLLQSKFEEIQELETIPDITDDVLEKGKTYFTYKLYKVYTGSDTGKQYTYRINLLGFIERIQDDEENTLEIVDSKSEELENKMKELNMRSSFDDVSVMDGIRKIQVQAEVSYNELNNGLF
jgi:hypothetical protein